MQKQTTESYVKSKTELEVNPEKTDQELELEEFYRPEEKRKAREELQKLMNQFIAKGGTIEKVKAADAVPPTLKELRSMTKHFKRKGKKRVNK